MKNSFITEKGSMYFTKTKYGKTMKEKTRSHERSPITDHRSRVLLDGSNGCSQRLAVKKEIFCRLHQDLMLVALGEKVRMFFDNVDRGGKRVLVFRLQW